MFRHVFAFLIINTYYSSLGNPIETTSKNLTNSLNTLASQCGNEFLSAIIKSRLSDCAVIVPLYTEKQFECLMFYDINTQLCAAAPTLVLSGEDTVKINATQNVNNLCNSAKDWVFTTLQDYVQYKDTANKVLKNPVTCGKICGVEKVMSENANFYCKYFNWGSEILKSLAGGSKRNTDGNTTVGFQAENTTLTAQTSGQSTQQMKPKTTIKLNVSQDKTSDSIDLNVNHVVDGAVGDVPSSHVNKKTNGTVLTTGTKNDLSAGTRNNSSAGTKNDFSAGTRNDLSAGSTNDLSAGTRNDLSAGSTNDLSAGTRNDLSAKTTNDLSAGTRNDLTLETGMEAPSGHNIALEPKPGSDAQNNANEYVGNDIDSDEGREEVVDTQGGDDEEDPGNMDTKPDQGKIKANIENTPPNSQKQDVYAIPDGFSEDDDDHFFSFFLTAIILVVVLYILYHNKNKVSKVVMGLILEGRQPGRRRNSRGHAYRRLDTLEQAMSAKSAAPPSKIIY